MPKFSKQIGYVILEAPMMTPDAKNITVENGRVIAEGTVQDADIKNRNKRIYQAVELFPAVLESKRINELLRTGNMKGEDGHPMDGDIKRQSTIDPKLVSVKYLKFWRSGNKMKARFQGTNTLLGEYFDRDLRCGEKPSFSLRALGGLETKGGENYVKNINPITYDRVIYPSHASAYTDKIVSESTCMGADIVDRVMTENNIIADDKGTVTPILNQQIIDMIKTESTNVMGILENFELFYQSIDLTKDKRHVKIVSEDGDIFVVSLEQHIMNEIMGI